MERDITIADEDFIQHLPEVQRKNLESSDILFVDLTTNAILCIVERKTCSDLLSSLFDGRYGEQKQRLVRSGVPDVRYMVTCDDLRHLKPEQQRHIWGAIESTYAMVISSEVYLADRLAAVWRHYARGKPQRHFVLGASSTEEAESQTNMDSLKHLTKAKINEPKDAVVMQLSAVNGVSVEKARAIVEHFEFTSISDVVDVIRDGREKGHLDKAIFSGVNCGKKTLGPVLSERLCFCLTGEKGKTPTKKRKAEKDDTAEKKPKTSV